MDTSHDMKKDDAQRLETIDFHHPYTPYHVQEQFMKTVFQILQTGQGQVGILESPTGTGKSLSLICASLTWLRNHKSKGQDAALEAAAEAYKDEPSWLIEQLLQRKKDEITRIWEQREKLLESARSKEREREERSRKRQRRDNHAVMAARWANDDEAKWLVDDWESPSQGLQDAFSGLSKDSQEVLERFGFGGPKKRKDEEDILEEEIKAINDRCAELQQAKSGKKCPYAPNEELIDQTHQFRDTALATLPDIEDLHQLGKTLQESAREALGIKLEGSVVIIDEAHNIMDAVANVHAAEITLSELHRARSMLGTYVKRFGKKLKSENQVNVGRLGRVIDGLAQWMEGASKFKEDRGVVAPSDLMQPKGIDQINLFELVHYIHGSKIAYKIEGYAAQVENEKDTNKSGRVKSSRPVLHELVSFLAALTNTSEEGRFFYRLMGGTPANTQLSYLLLSPTHAFSSIVSSARAVILAGGTMSPFEDYRNHLFPTLADSRVTTLSCNHVVSPSELCVRTLVSTRPNATPFEFSYQRRGNKDMIAELGIALLNICFVVPDGVIVFFPSYGYLEQVTDAWRQQLQKPQQSIWDRLQARKSVFLEMKGGSSDDVLAQYSETILGTGGDGKVKAKGALLLSVVGGKMSEGINFSDRLGRCVVIVGMPYPNAASPEWKAKMEYVASSTRRARSREEAEHAARDFYENSCMRAVNQSIGRAIRHRGDYAAIVLADRRYGTGRVRNKLPGWIRSGMADDDVMLGGLISALGRFFRSKT